MLPFVLMAVGKLYKHPKSPTMYLTIPSKVVGDSAFVFKPGERVEISYDPAKKQITVVPAKTKENASAQDKPAEQTPTGHQAQSKPKGRKD